MKTPGPSTLVLARQNTAVDPAISASAKRGFSFLTSAFSSQSERALEDYLEDYLEASVMLRYNNTKRS